MHILRSEIFERKRSIELAEVEKQCQMAKFGSLGNKYEDKCKGLEHQCVLLKNV